MYNDMTVSPFLQQTKNFFSNTGQFITAGEKLSLRHQQFPLRLARNLCQAVLPRGEHTSAQVFGSADLWREHAAVPFPERGSEAFRWGLR
jgi:hypothetical protein